MKKLMMLSLFFALSNGISALTTEELFEEGCVKYLASHSGLCVISANPMTLGKVEYNIPTILGLAAGASLTGLLSWAAFSAASSGLLNDKTLKADEVTSQKVVGSVSFLATIALLYALTKYYRNDAFVISSKGLLIPKYGLIKWANLAKVKCSTVDETSSHLSLNSFGINTAFDGTYQNQQGTLSTPATAHVIFTLKSGMRIQWNGLPTNMAQDMFDFINHMINGIEAQSSTAA